MMFKGRKLDCKKISLNLRAIRDTPHWSMVTNFGSKADDQSRLGRGTTGGMETESDASVGGCYRPLLSTSYFTMHY